MNKEIDVEKIRGLLEEEIEFTKGCPDDCEHIDAHAHKAGLAQLLSLLKPCSTCGGSGFGKHDYKRTCSHEIYVCSRCGKEAARFTKDDTPCPCPDCQVPAGKVEEFVKKIEEEIKYVDKFNDILWLAKNLRQACTHLITLLKQIKILQLKARLVDRLPFCPDHRDKVADKPCRECRIEQQRDEINRLATIITDKIDAPVNTKLQAKIKQLEEGAFAANEEAQARNDQIKRLRERLQALQEKGE